MWWLLACTGPPEDTAVSPPEAGIYEGRSPDEGYGMRVARRGHKLIVGAPMSGRVYSGRRAHLWGSSGSFYGAALAVLDDGRVLLGSPGSDRVVDFDSGDVVAEGEHLGGVLVTNGRRWVTTMHSGVRWDSGEVEYVGRRPDALALFDDDTLAVGFATGPVAVRIGATELARKVEGDGEGYALLAADVDADGVEELLVGAPGAGEVRVYERDGTAIATVRGDGGRFGHALAWAGDLYVGAPMVGDAAGAVYRSVGLAAPERIDEGHSDDAQLGFALWADDDVLIAGAPEGPGAPGHVKVSVR